MRFITADIIYTLSGQPLKNGVIVLDEKNQVQDVLASATVIDAGKLEKYSGSICPGFVNAHCHLELSHLKGLIPKKTGIVDFVGNVIKKRNEIARDIRQESIRLADEEMKRNGIVAVGDISNDNSSLEVKTKSKLHYHTFVELIGFNPAFTDKIMDSGKQLRNEFVRAGLAATLVPHAPYSVSGKLMKHIAAENNGVPYSIHNQESRAENEFFEKGSGDIVKLYRFLNLNIDYFDVPATSSLQAYLPSLISSGHLALIHNTFSSEEDVLFAEKLSDKLFWCLCPNANLYIENSLPNIELLRSNKCKLVVGTDSLASNHGLSVLDELNVICKAYPHIPLEEVLSWACLNGAIFLAIDNKYGSIEKGKTPGLLLLKSVEGKWNQVSRIV
ncbi:MAG: amidohydrolase family protein [Bacteroidia bacterium]